MPKSKKAAPKKDKVSLSGNITKRKSLKRATSTPLSKGKALLSVTGISPCSDETLNITSSAKEDKPESILETPKRAVVRKQIKRTGSALNSIKDITSPKKIKETIKVVRGKKNDTAKTTTELDTNGTIGRKRSSRIKALSKQVIATKSPSPKNKKPARGATKRTKQLNEPKTLDGVKVIGTSTVTNKSRNTTKRKVSGIAAPVPKKIVKKSRPKESVESATKIKKAPKKVARKSIGIVSTKARKSTSSKGSSRTARKVK